MRSHTQVLVVSAVIVSLVAGLVLLLFAVVSYQESQPRLILWYWKETRFYRFDVGAKTSQLAGIQVNEHVESATLSPDGRSLAFADRSGLRIFSMSQKSSKVLLPAGAGDIPTAVVYQINYLPLSWSPDGNWLLIHKADWEVNYVYLFSLRSHALRPLPPIDQDLPLALACETGLSWSPDSRAITTGVAGLGMCRGEGGGLYIIARDSLHAERIYSETVPYGPDLKWTMLGSAAQMQWSPLGSSIVFIQDSYIPGTGYRTRLMAVNPVDHQARILAESATHLSDPVWEPNGKRIYYVVDRSKSNSVNLLGNDEIHSINIDSSDNRLIYSGVDLTLLSVSPDGHWLAFTQSQTPQSLTLYILNLTTFEIRQVSDGVGGYAGWELSQP
jgi:Tol biopolymer transport system component